MKNTNKFNSLKLLILSFLILFSCEDYLEIEHPNGEIGIENVFEDESLATAAVNNLYTQLRDEVLVTGGFNGMSITMGLYSDEFDYYSLPGNSLESFYLHNLTADNNLILTIWNNAYRLIYRANSIIKGLENSNTLDMDFKNQLKGEALFVRALCHFYLTNLFGNIPYIIDIDYQFNEIVFREDKELVNSKIIEDLILSKTLLSPTYPTGERIRANRFVVSALLARVYLYNEHWDKAINEATDVINYTTYYLLEDNINDEFLKNSTSAILQLMPSINGENTREGAIMNFSNGPPLNVALTNKLYDSMLENDLRKQFWIKVVSNGNSTWYANNKYKESGNTGTTLEYSIVFRLSEQYLIRAESHTKLGNIEAAVQDINIIRSRAGLTDIEIQSPSDLMNAIINERRWELFGEHGHRWFDLKRNNLAYEVLSPVKPNWQNTNLLLPLPENEILNNPNLLPQNPGY